MRTRLIALALLVSAALLATAKERMPYIYRRDGNHTHIRGGFDHIGPISRKYGNDFVWFRLDGRSYVIRDAATLAEVRNAFRHLDELEPSLRDVERRLKPFEREMEKIEERVDELGDSLGDERLSQRTREDMEEKLRDAEEKMRAVEEKARVIEREMERLEKESERREEIAEKQFEAILERAVKRGIAERVD
jgi:chromosome segregation ATPase